MNRAPNKAKKKERGLALVETSIAMMAVLITLFGAVEVARLLWTYNALTDATRRGARWAVVNPQNMGNVKNVVVYNSPNGGTEPIVYGLDPTTHVTVSYTGFNVASGQVTVTIQNYDFDFVVPLFGASVTLPPFTTTLTGESAGVTAP